MLIAGLSEGSRNGAAALADGGRLVGVCAQERVTRVRSRIDDEERPAEALNLLLDRLGRTAGDIDATVVAASGSSGLHASTATRLGHHHAHACTAFLTSPFESATILVCDREAPKVSVWTGRGSDVRPVQWTWNGAGFSDLSARLAALFGFTAAAAEQRFDALARLAPGTTDEGLRGLLALRDDGVSIDAGLEPAVQRRLDATGGDILGRAKVAAALQAGMGDLLLELIERVRTRVGGDRLCLGGTYFYHSQVNSRVKQSTIFERVFVPVDPGNAGTAVGAALAAVPRVLDPVTPFLGPSYSSQETKETLDNCKLQYEWVSEDGAIAAALGALQHGRLVAWFSGGMEWGPRALGARCILANPLAPYVLENLNTFLKKREVWRGYALSGLLEATADAFDGPTDSPNMECDFLPREPSVFRHVLPAPRAAVRLHTVASDGHRQLRRLLEAFGAATGVPFLVNTSFNGFHEPIVCSPRDAVRVFYGSGLDVMILDQFVVRK